MDFLTTALIAFGNMFPSLHTQLIAPAEVDTIKIDLLEETELEYSSDVTEFPVETGFTISDHIINKQPVLRLDVMFTPTPVTWELDGDPSTHLSDVVRELERIRDQREPISVRTHKRFYENMVLVNIPIKRRIRDGISLRMRLEFKKIAIVTTNTAEVPKEYAEQEKKVQAQMGKTETNAGVAATTDIGSGGSGSTGEYVSSGDTNSSYETGQEETANRPRSILKGISSGGGNLNAIN